MINFLTNNREIITLLIAICGLALSLYNFFKDKRKFKLYYILEKNEKSNRLILTGILTNPSKNPNSIIECVFLYNGEKVDCSRYFSGGFDMGHFHKPSIFSPIELTQSVPPGSSIAFSEVLKLKDLLPGDRLIMLMKTANYQKKFHLKIKDSF